MRTTAILGLVAMTCAGCAMDVQETGGGEEQAGEVKEDLGTYFGKFAISDAGRVGPTSFHVAQGGTIDAEVSSAWTPKSGYSCKGSLAMLIPKKRSAPTSTLRGKTFHAGAPGQTVGWSGLAAGDYDLTLDAMNDNPNCVLAGDVNITVRP